MPTSPRRPAKKGGSVTKPKAANVKRLNIKALSHLIARELFTNYHGEVVGQLRLMEDCTPLARSYGGWGEAIQRLIPSQPGCGNGEFGNMVNGSASTAPQPRLDGLHCGMCGLGVGS